MKDQLTKNATQDRFDDHHEPRTHWDWSGKRNLDAFATAWALTDSRPGRELLTVASAALSWWETHQHDTTVVNGESALRYPSVPSFVTHAHAVMMRAAR